MGQPGRRGHEVAEAGADGGKRERIRAPSTFAGALSDRGHGRADPCPADEGQREAIRIRSRNGKAVASVWAKNDVFRPWGIRGVQVRTKAFS